MRKWILLLLCLMLPVGVHASVNTLTGNLTYRLELFAAQGGPLALQMELAYESFERYDAPFGPRWSHNYDIFLNENTDGTMVLAGGTGKRFYTPQGNGYKARTGDFSTLVRNGDNTWTVALRSGLRYQFGVDKKLTAIIDRYGNTVTVASAADQTTVTDPVGRQAVIHYSAGKIDWVKDPDQKQYDFTYHPTTGLLKDVTFPDPIGNSGIRPTWGFLYTSDNYHYLAYATDPKGQIYKFQYSKGKVTRTVDPEGVLNTSGAEKTNATLHSQTLAYGKARSAVEPNATTLTEKDGGQWVYRYDTVQGVLLSKEDPEGNRVEFKYYLDVPTTDPKYGLLQEKVEPVKFESSAGNTVKTVYVTEYAAYDGFGNTMAVKGYARHLTYDTSGALLSTINDPSDLHLSYEYGSYDRVRTISDLLTGTTTSLAYNTTFDANGNISSETVTITAPKIKSTDTGGPQTVIQYDTRGLVDLVTDPLGRQTDFIYTASGLPQSLIDVATGIKTEFADHNAFGLPKTAKVIGSGGQVQTTLLDYDAVNRLKTVTRPNIVLAEGATPTNLLTQFGYDLVGNRTSVTDAENSTTTYDYNSRGQVTEITDALLKKTILEYSGSGCSSCGAGVDKLVAVIDANHSTMSDPPKHQFTYYETGELKSEIAPGDPETRRLLYTYYPGGQLKEKRRDADGDGEVGSGDQLLLSFVWHPDGRPASKTDHLVNETTNFSYYPNGRLQTAANLAVTYSFDYYDNGWPKSVTDNSGRVIRYDEYDKVGQREFVSILQDTTVLHTLDYVYDTQKRLKDVVSSAGTFSFGYDPFGRRGSLAYPNGITATYGYHADMNWLTGLTYKNSAGVALLDLGYPRHDKVGNRKERKEGAMSSSYTYDALYQLTQAKTGVAEENLSYDPVGNRTEGPTDKEVLDQTYIHDDANRMLKGRKLTYDYDDSGNQRYRYLTADGSKRWEFKWNGDNRLVEAKLVKSGAILRTVSFKYDPFGRRIEKMVVDSAGTVTRTYVYDGEDIVLEYVNNGTTTTTTQYVHGPGIDEPLAMVRGGQAYFYHADGLGSVVAITDSAKAIKQRYTYESFGMLTPQDPAFDNAYAYTGREWDKEIGLYYYRARYYDPMEGRFISRDPIGFAGGDVNLYGYVQGNPANYVDASGLSGGRYMPPQPRGNPLIEAEVNMLLREIRRVEPEFCEIRSQNSTFGRRDVELLREHLNNLTSYPINMSRPGSGPRGALNEVLRQNGVPTSSSPVRVEPNIRDGKQQPGVIMIYERMTPGGGREELRIRNDVNGSFFGPNNPQNRGPHFNDPAGRHFDYGY